MSLRDRVTIIFAVAVGTVLVISAVGLVLVRLDDPSADLGGPVSTVGSIIAALGGYVVGATRDRGGA